MKPINSIINTVVSIFMGAIGGITIHQYDGSAALTVLGFIICYFGTNIALDIDFVTSNMVIKEKEKDDDDEPSAS
jgi:hypothetical protein